MLANLNRRWPARAAAVLSAAALAWALLFAAADAQERPKARPPSVPDAALMAWTALVALDQANRTGNYTVLRDLAGPRFRAANDAAGLAVNFAQLRASGLPLDRVVTVNPRFEQPPAIGEDGLLRLRGLFPMRPVSIAFELIYEREADEWRLFGITVQPVEFAARPAPDTGSQ